MEFENGQDILGSCEYASKDKTRNVSAELIDSAKYTDRKAMEGMQSVSGLGDEAFRDTTNGFFYVKRGAKAFRVNITGTGATNANTTDATRKLAELILARV